ncbi:Na+/H+ antiporter subunit E [Phycisphaerales bacterium ac7]
MKQLTFNLFLAVVWCLLTASFSAWNFVAGALVGAAVVAVYSSVAGQGSYFKRAWGLLAFAGHFVKILTKANIQIAWEILTPAHNQSPRILRYPVDGLSDVEKTTLANAITLTPGTLVVDISPDGKWLYLHCMYAQDPASTLAEIDDLALRLRKAVFS